MIFLVSLEFKNVEIHCNTIQKCLRSSCVLVQLMTCKDAINSDTSSDEEKLYLLNEIRRSSKILYAIYDGL